MKKKPRKPRLIRLRFRKNDPSHNLVAATQAWILANGGNAIVLGGISIMNEGALRYRVCIGALGRAPTKEKK